MKKITCILIILISLPIVAYAQDFDHLTGTAIILTERSTGRVLFERNSEELIYPASMIKVATAIVALDYIALDDILVVGEEIRRVPFGSSVVGHVIGEHISGINAIRGLLIPSGNDTSNVVAAHVAGIVTGNDNLPFPEAEIIFVDLMNRRARQIGAFNTNFTNAHGFHDPLMQTTAADMALIADYALNIDIIRQVAAEMVYIDNTWPEAPAGVLTRNVEWHSTNRLLVGRFYYPYAIGLKTGFTTPAGRCFMGAAHRNGIELISIIAGSTDPERWYDTMTLFDYGFNNYSFHPVSSANQPISEINIENPRWGDETSVFVVGENSFYYFLTEAESRSIQTNIIYNHLALRDEDGRISFAAPLYAGDVVGEIIYLFNGQEIFRNNVIIYEDILPFTYLSAIIFLANFLRENPFTIYGLGFALGVIFIGIVVYKTISLVRRGRGRRYRYTGYRLPGHK